MTTNVERSRILVVDDDPSILRTIGRIFEREYEVERAANGAAALALLERFLPDVAIVDVRMPEMNGLELMKRLHARFPDLDVIVMTGTSEEPDANLVQAIDAGAFYFVQKPFDRRVLVTLITRCLELRRLREERERHVQSLKRDLDEARLFQMSLLPPAHAQIDELSIDARYVSCHELAGDFYDYARAGPRSVAIFIADVVGHGTSAAMLTSVAKSAFRAAQVDAYDPQSVVDRVKDGIRAFDSGRFITLCAARIDLESCELRYINAGHPSPLLLRRGGGHVLLDSTGPLISSALHEIPCPPAEVELSAGDLLLFYTDGVTEARGPQKLFGVDRLESLVVGNKARGGQLLDSILSAVSEFCAGRPVQDDMTLVTAEINCDAAAG
jgi:sigma-B regulation protein RsbU (phosphoserine phosphatase)